MTGKSAPPLMLTVREVGNLMRMCKSSIHNLLDDGTLPKRKIGGKVLIPSSAVYELLGLDVAS